MILVRTTWPVVSASHSFATAITVSALATACGGSVMDLGRDDASEGDAGRAPRYATREELMAEPRAGSGVPTVVATRQGGTEHFVVDDKRIFWTNHCTRDLATTSHGESPCYLRSCAKDDCAGTLITYSKDAQPIGPIAANGTRVFFVDRPSEAPGSNEQWRVRSCHVEGCESGWAEVATETQVLGVTADDTHVYWMPTDATIRRCPVAGCGGAPPELVTRAEHPLRSGYLATPFSGDSTRLVWGQHNELSGVRLVELDKSGSGPIRDIAELSVGPSSFAADEERVYWTEIVGDPVKSCLRTGCGKAHEVFAEPGGVSSLLGAKGGRLYGFWGASSWFGRPEPVPTDLFECSSVGCDGALRRLVVGQQKPCAIAVDDTHVYWGTCLQPEGPIPTYLDGEILRIKR